MVTESAFPRLPPRSLKVERANIEALTHLHLARSQALKQFKEDAAPLLAPFKKRVRSASAPRPQLPEIFFPSFSCAPKNARAQFEL